MLRLFVTAFALLAFIEGAAADEWLNDGGFLTAKGLAKACDEKSGELLCYGFVAGVLNTMEISRNLSVQMAGQVSADDPMIRAWNFVSACPAHNIGIADAAKLVAGWIAVHPDYGERLAADAVMVAMQESFPCR